MLFDSSIRKELARSFGATLVVLVTVVMTMMLIRTLGLASQGNVNPSEVGLVLGFTMLGHLPTVLTMSLFIGGLAFAGLGPTFELQLKLGVLGGSIVAGLLGTLLLWMAHRTPSR